MIVKAVAKVATARRTIAVTRLAVTFALVAFALVLVLLILQLVEVPFSRLAKGHILKWTLTGHTAHIGQLALKVGVDSEVSRDVPQLGHASFGKATSHMLKDKVVKFVLENAQLLLVGQTLKELRIIKHNERTAILVHLDASSRDSGRSSLVDAT